MLREPASTGSSPTDSSGPSPPNNFNGTWAELPWTACSDLPLTGTCFDACYPWETTTFLPLLADEMYLTAIGCGFSGRMCFNADGEDANVIRLDVTMYCTSPSLQGAVKVRRCQPEPGKHGLMFVTPAHLAQQDRVFFHVDVRFPSKSVVHFPVTISRLITKLPQFSHIVGHLGETIMFDYIFLAGFNAPITIQDIRVNHAQLRTSNAPIEVGFIVASGSLSLATSNGFINANTTLTNVGRAGTMLDMCTSNGPITSTVELCSQNADSGTYQVRATTSNNTLKLGLESALQNTTLRLDATTSNAPVDVQLYPSFEGGFSVQTSNALANVQYTPEADPEGGQRQIQQQHSGWSVLTGTVVRGQGQKQTLGNANIITSNAPVRLCL